MEVRKTYGECRVSEALLFPEGEFNERFVAVLRRFGFSLVSYDLIEDGIYRVIIRDEYGTRFQGESITDCPAYSFVFRTKFEDGVAEITSIDHKELPDGF